MKRAAILIGVNRTGNLPLLNDAVKGAQRMAQWARDQGIAEKDIQLLTDEAAPLDVGDVKRAIRRLVDSATVDQLIVYFAGHGVNIRYGEYWLFSDAPVDTQAAVNVEGSIALARLCGIPHVVLVSDACRTAAEGIQAQFVTGSEIFPNDPVGGPEQPVDIFFGSTLGKPAFEVKDPHDSAGRFTALFTDTLIHGLQGDFDQAVAAGMIEGESARVVRPRLLKKVLQAQMAQRISALDLQAQVNQIPDARITSDDEAWISRLPLVAAPRAATLERGASRGAVEPARSREGGAGVVAPPTLHEVSADLLDTALNDGPTTSRSRGANAEPVVAPGAEANALARGAARGATAFGPLAFETQCGFKARGARIVESVSAHAAVELPGGGGDVVRVNKVAGPAASVLLVLNDGSSVLLPAIPEFIASLSFEDDELADVSYEPSSNGWRWSEYQRHGDELRRLRGIIAAAARFGVFRLEGDNALTLARRMQYAKGIDPALSLYAAYAYHDMQRQDLIGQMADFQRRDLGFVFFDIGLVGRKLDGTTAGGNPGFFPCFPLLAQGWALLSANRIRLPDGLDPVRQHLRSSLWTHFTPDGTTLVRDAILSGRVR